MHVEKKRIFVGNLPPYVEENDIRNQFSNYGKVVSVDIKQRKINADENVSPVFAFVNVEIDNKTLQKCFQEISNYDWQGYYVNLELAKESFLERLKREREEAQAETSQNNSSTSEQQLCVPLVQSTPKQNGTVTPSKTTFKKKECSSSSSSSSDSDSDNDNKKSIKNKVTPVKTITKVSKKKESSSSSSSDSESSDEEPRKIQNNKTPVAEETEDEDGIKLVIKSNKHKVHENGRLKIESVNSTPIHIITKKCVKNVQKDERSLAADEKRKQSLIQMKNSYSQQQSAIRNALSRIDSKQNKTSSNDDKQSFKKRNYNETNSLSKKQKLALFEDEGEEDQSENINFSVKSHFEGREGQKLLALQSRFTNDKRFALDQRFAGDEEEMEVFGDDEKEKQLEILESVLGHKVRKDFRDENKTSNIPKGMLRFDPSKPEHSKFEIKRDEYSKKDKRKEKKEQEREKVEVAPIPEVSKETFYEVKTNLKESLKTNEGFSLLSMFGKVQEKKDDEAEYEPPETSEEIKKNKQIGYNQNPFKYDSSDTEDEETDNRKNKHKQKKGENVEAQPAFRWSESFFFETNDSRLKDGLDFVKNINNVGKFESFKEKRRAVSRVFHGKVKHVERDRKKNMFRKKLSKRIKVKKAKRS